MIIYYKAVTFEEVKSPNTNQISHNFEIIFTINIFIFIYPVSTFSNYFFQQMINVFYSPTNRVNPRKALYCFSKNIRGIA